MDHRQHNTLTGMSDPTAADHARASLPSISMIVFDVDGTLTDGGLVYDSTGGEIKRFHVRDGFAFTAALSVGVKIGVITARQSPIVTRRMAELNVPFVMQGQRDKKIAIETLCQQAGLLPEQVAYVGDDILDLPALLMCGYPIAVADAVEEVKYVAKYVTQLPGGHGAARDAIEHILKAQGKWEAVVDQFGI
jgi:3-deoxy-D-manno-octulosonate 8-phosphate phosphatase (KDO 8-P phosphatase)